MDQFQFLKELDQLPPNPGDGVRVTKNLNVASDLRTAAGLVLTAATAPAVVNAETNAIVVQSVASATAGGSFVFVVPEDYDTTRDELKLNVLVNSAGTTDAPTLTATAFNKRVSTALSSALTVVASAAVPSSTAIAAFRTIVLSGNKLKGGDVLTINIVTGAHTTDAINIYGVEVQNRSQIVFGDTTKRFA